MGILENEETGVESMKHSVVEMTTTCLPNQTFLSSGQVAIWEHQPGRPPQCPLHSSGFTSSSSFDKPFLGCCWCQHQRAALQGKSRDQNVCQK